jgi:sphingolipid delta-4 desaturase
MGFGGSAAPARRTDFFWSTEGEPHATRRKAILKKYPQVNKLMGPEPRTKYIVVVLVLAQVALSIAMRNASWPVYLLVTYVVGGTLTHALFLAIHELAHNLGARQPWANRLIAIVANLPIVFPYSVTFKQYHIDHHKMQGVDGVDSDIPARLEATIFQGRLGKLAWCLSQIAFYAFRPMWIKLYRPTSMHAVNFLAQVRGSRGGTRQRTG